MALGDYEMVRRYAHPRPVHLRAYADRVLVTPAAHKRKKRAQVIVLV